MANVLNKVKGWFADCFWKTFCVAWIWNLLCKKWIWQKFCVNLLYKKFDKWKAWLYLSPALILLAIFTVWPLINTVKMAFTAYHDPNAPIYKLDENGDYIFDDDTGEMVVERYG